MNRSREEHIDPAPNALHAPPESTSAGLKGCVPGGILPLQRFNPDGDKLNVDEEEVEGNEEEEGDEKDEEGGNGSPRPPLPPETWR